MPKHVRYLIGLLCLNFLAFGGNPAVRAPLTLPVPPSSPEPSAGDVSPLLHISPSPTAMAVGYASPSSVTLVLPCVAVVNATTQPPVVLQQVVDPAVLARLNSITRVEQ